MLMVVFGAGASYDSSPTYPPHTSSYSFGENDRLPLANELFENRGHFVRALSQFPKCLPIVPYLRDEGDGIQIEKVLQSLQDEADEYPERHKQLAAVRFYLQYMLWECEHRWNERVTQGVTNQKTFLDQIERWRKPNEQVCLVTFNYDTMLERALSTVGVEIEALTDYVASDRYKLIKLHGSINWGRRVETPYELLQRSAWDIVNTLIDNAASLKITQDYALVEEHPIHAVNESVVFPALAIPVESKLDFECPQEHIEALHAAIPLVDKLLVIGWRGAETTFLELLATYLRDPIHALVVAGNKEQATETADRMGEAGVRGERRPTEGGFTDLVVTRLADDFLRR